MDERIQVVPRKLLQRDMYMTCDVLILLQVVTGEDMILSMSLLEYEHTLNNEHVLIHGADINTHGLELVGEMKHTLMLRHELIYA